MAHILIFLYVIKSMDNNSKIRDNDVSENIDTRRILVPASQLDQKARAA